MSECPQASDASKRQGVLCINVSCHYLIYNICNKAFEVHSAKREWTDIVINELSSQLRKFNIERNVICFWSDNTI